MATKNTPAVKGKTAVVSMQELMEKQAADIANKIGAPGGDKIVVNTDKTFSFPDGRKSGDPFKAIIVEFVSGNFYFDSPYVKGQVSPPACFALGEDPDELVPSDNSPDKQSDACKGCPMNEFGSDGAGKACDNRRLLALLPPEFDKDTPLAIISPSATALKGYDGYVSKLAGTFRKPPAAFVTTIGFNPKVDYAQLMFGNPEPIEDEARLALVFSRQEEAKARLLTEPDVSGYEAPKPARPGPGSKRR